MDTTKKPNLSHISLCFGYGGIDLGLHSIFGDRLRLAAVCEIEAFALENALSKMEAGLIPAAPIWNDLRTFPWEEFPNVTLVSGGFPCQPFSSAGKREGDQDPRHLFPFIVDGIKRCRPRLVFLENVEGILSSKLAGEGWSDPAGTPVLLHVLRELERVGYRATAGIFSAAEVGAPHQRKRVFILAYDGSAGLQGGKWFWQAGAQGSSRGHATECGGAMADSNGGGMSGSRNELGNSGEVGQGWTNTSQDGIIGNVWPSRPGQPQYAWEPPRVVGNATSKRSCGGSEDRANQQPEMLGEGHETMGESECSEIKPKMGRDTHGATDGMDISELSGLSHSELAEIREWMVKCDNRTDELRSCGNGVVPATAERAFRVLIEELINK